MSGGTVAGGVGADGSGAGCRVAGVGATGVVITGANATGFGAAGDAGDSEDGAVAFDLASDEVVACVALVDGTRNSKPPVAVKAVEEGSWLKAVADAEAVAIAGILSLILLGLEYSGRAKGGGRSDINCRK